MFHCTRGACEKIRPPYNCERRCLDIPTRNKNVILLSGDRVHLSKCSTAYNLTTKMELWNESDSNILMASCFQTRNTPEGVEALDCINGGSLNTTLGDYTNFTHLLNLHLGAAENQPMYHIAPPDSELTISNDSKLMINLEGCVNTLRDECKDFFRVFAKDGSDHNARARFPCFYSEIKIDTAVVRFDLETTYQQFMFAFLLPTILLVVSCTILVLCQRTVVVGNDSKMRFKCLTAEGAGQPNMGHQHGDVDDL